MTRKEQNKILDAKIESNVNQYKVVRLNAEISAFSSGYLNKYEFLKRIDLNYKPDALDKARFEFFPLGKTFSTGLDKTAQGYQEEGIMKLLKDIRDALAVGIIPRGPDRPDDNDDDDDDDNDNNNDDDDNDNDNDDNDMPDLETEEEVAKTNILNKLSIKINNFDEIVKNKLNNDVKKLRNYVEENNDKIINKEKELDIVKNERDALLLKLNQSNEELNITKNKLNITKKKLDEAEDDINEKIKYINKLKEIKENLDYQNNKAKELESELNEKNKYIETLENNIKNLKNKNRKIIAKSKTSDDKVFDLLNKFKNNIESKMSDLDNMEP